MIYTGAVFFHIGATGENEPIIVNSIGRAWDLTAVHRPDG
jgi:cytochrome bd-type quinol oxidase subunit 2